MASITARQSINGSRTDTFSWNLDGADNKDNGGGGNNFVNINPGRHRRIQSADHQLQRRVRIQRGRRGEHRDPQRHARSFTAAPTSTCATTPFRRALSTPPPSRSCATTTSARTSAGRSSSRRNSTANRDKLFFFFGTDFKRLRQGAINTWTVPVPAPDERRLFRAGRFASGRKTRRRGAVFPGGIIPKNRFSPNSYRLLQNYPAPNFTGSGGNFVFPTVAPLTTNQYILKGDYNLDPRIRFRCTGCATTIIPAEPDQPGAVRAAHSGHQRRGALDLRSQRHHRQLGAVRIHRQRDQGEGRDPAESGLRHGLHAQGRRHQLPADLQCRRFHSEHQHLRLQRPERDARSTSTTSTASSV